MQPINKTTWEALSPKEKWDVMSALRGPDLHPSWMVKYFSTSVIRHAMSKVIRVGGLVNDAIGVVFIPTGASCSLIPSNFDAGHFFTHVTEAARILKIPTYSIPCAFYWDLFIISDPTTYHHPTILLSKLLPRVKDGATKEMIEGYLKAQGWNGKEKLNAENYN